MILSCPKCATGYFVEDDQLGPRGRQVRCAACGTKWTAAPALARQDGAEEPVKPSIGGAEFPKAFRARARLRKRWREAAFAGAGLGAAVVAVFGLGGSALVFRTDVVRVLPGASGLYSAMGLPVNRLGLEIESVSAEPTLQDGHAALAVFGVIRNIEDRSIPSPPLRIALYNGRGQRLDGRTATAANLRIPAGAKRRFAVAILDPPLAATNLEVGFAPDAAPSEPGGVKPFAPTRSAQLAPPALKGPLDPPPPVSPAASNLQS
jgi:predicted Zn finger-like uncharacterized protein